MIQNSHALNAGEKQPLDTVERSVVKHGNSLYVNVTSFAQRIHNIQVGDDVDVHITNSGLVIGFNSKDEGEN